MSWVLFLFKQEAPAFDPVLHMETMDRKFFSLHDQPFFVERVKEKGISEPGIGHFKDLAEDGFQWCRCIEMEVFGAVGEAETVQQSG